MNITSRPAVSLADLYDLYSARLTAHVAELLGAAGAELIVDAEDIAQDTWVWAAQQRRLPGWEGLSVMAIWVIEEAIEKQRARPETATGLRPAGTPVVPLEQGPLMVERIPGGTRAGVAGWYTARRDAAGQPTDAAIDQITVAVTTGGHWFRSDDVRDDNRDWSCRGRNCPAVGHFAYILDSHGACPAPATDTSIRAALLAPSPSLAATGTDSPRAVSAA
ncbi:MULTISPECIES: hypothetical protein [unclassified Streptomyces]|uniref:hypothetical protein n=1 Tax=unclassified Streptomyces TaxID=2593676 RepID=UPI00081D4D46|nr:MULTISPECIES: hypothetical protein [unclassified Streptomyces]MYZ34397.1 hypothetical protein [Streptomyces sp. SID4917]SCF67123.1 hypothetical protein GA0115259_100882 [Streptomyces sp. MnatMP-M17]